MAERDDPLHASTYAHDNCAYADVLMSIGINTPVASIVTNPIRVGTWAFWQATAWVELGQIFQTYPGVAAVRARTRALCPRATVWLTPSAMDWDSLYTRGWCWTKFS